MTTINANAYPATTQTVADAISRSISHNEIVTIEAGTQRDAIEAELARECEGDTDANHDVHEFWGTDCDGAEWRVHVTSL